MTTATLTGTDLDDRNDVLVSWSTATGETTRFVPSEDAMAALEGLALSGDADDDMWDRQDYCFVCNRPTDHFAEHDDAVDKGEAFYDIRDGKVRSATVYTAFMWHAWANPAIKAGLVEAVWN